MEKKENIVRKGVSWKVLQQSRPIAALLWDVSGSPEPSLIISFIKKESFKPNLKSGKGVCFPDIYWQLIPQERGPIAEGSASHSTFRNSGSNK